MNPEIRIIQTADGAEPWTYEALERLQDRVAERVLAGGQGALIFSELEPVVTLGKRTDRERDLKEEPASFDRLGIGLRDVRRGGLATWHGPGQWVMFAVDRLERLCGDPRGVRRAVTALLETAAEVAERYVRGAEVRWGDETGVWCASGKLASVGVQIRDGVLLHGLALNVRRMPESFYGIRLCGLDAQPAYLSDAVPEVEFAQVREELERAILRRFWKG